MVIIVSKEHSAFIPADWFPVYLLPTEVMFMRFHFLKAVRTGITGGINWRGKLIIPIPGKCASRIYYAANRLKHVVKFKFRSSWLRHCAITREVPGSIPRRVIGNFQLTYSFFPHSVVLASTRPLNRNECLGIFWGVKCGPARRAENSTVLFVPNVKVKVGARHSIPPLSLHDLLREFLTRKKCFWWSGYLSLLPVMLV